MSKRAREDFSEYENSHSNKITKNESLGNDKKSLFPDEIYHEIISFLDDKFKILTCSLISKQVFNVIRKYSKLILRFCRPIESNEKMMNNQFLENIVELRISTIMLNAKVLANILESFKFMTQLTSLEIPNVDLGEISESYFHVKDIPKAGIIFCQAISQLTNLQKLNVNNCKIGNLGVQFITQLGNLMELSVINTGMDAKGLNLIATRLKNLTKLQFNGTVQHVTSLSNMKQLTSLSMGFDVDVDVKGAKAISEMNNLTNLSLNTNDEGLEEICKMTQLTSLKVCGFYLTTLGLKFLPRLKKLRKLNLNDHEDFGNEGAKLISELDQLTSLEINDIGIDKKGAKFITNLKQLTSLTISNNPIFNEGVKYLTELPQLTNLNARFTKIDNEGVKYLSEMANLKILNIKRNYVQDLGVESICGMKNLTELDIEQNEISEEGVAKLKEMKQLKVLKKADQRASKE
ncbi:hypothetical protein NAEGRDRAFT_45222 [Naegleria gruberi]|uniref:Disease resistance R13L4/SHOC-2-like LRR domain-containing protein n=1 Tax=Naegleria gruberi TaxID=5762 RepID=D2UYN8_NAEGR|nr:uncharacterized protein NAEGRDRAFT_45222 [Naegleria gruberi]EFC50509.1 hypothetical protein NAEGRDRAFT_45222 [Naegleria gruberi]|eukprot:XP_002683253.1 hypothetical protein NAEGRDRAFT_45222 [Naegleria gruberi strain NEG-M]